LEGQALTATTSQLKGVTELAMRLETLLKDEARLETELEEVKTRRRQLEEKDLPEAMDGCNLSSFTLKSGVELVVASVVAGSITKANQPKAFAWLRENEHGGLIKTNFTIAFDRGQEQLTAKARKALAKLGVTVEEKESVNSQTLGAWAREMIRNNSPFPQDLLGIFTGRKIKINAPKK
jgi:hypothetical protein